MITSSIPGSTATRDDGRMLEVDFSKFGLDSYDLFLRCKTLPESQLAYDWERDTYTLSTPSRFARLLGIDPNAEKAEVLPLAPHLFDYQRFVVDRALNAKRFAAWCDTGLGKTAIYLEWARQVTHLTGSKVLILAPLQVIEQTREMAVTFYGNTLPIERLDSREALARWCEERGQGVAITNYEKLIPGILNELRFLGGIVSDESSILRSGGGVIKWNLIHSAKGIEYKLSCTATPAPNDTMEYASQASFLEKLRNDGEVLWTYFTRDKLGNWRVKPHARAAFYRFMASWSIYLRDPSHFGFGDILSTLPPPDIREYRIPMTDVQRGWMYDILSKNNKGLFSDDRMGIQESSKLSQVAKGFLYTKGEKQREAALIDSEKPRFVTNLVRSDVADGRQVLVWTVFDEESRILADDLKADPFTTAALDGSMSQEERTAVLERFRHGELRVLISKAQLIGYGMNFQFCRSMVFSGFDFSFERMYQAIRRCYRFGQTETVRVHIPYIPELEGMMFSSIKRKQAQFDEDTAIQERNYREALQEQLS